MISFQNISRFFAASAISLLISAFEAVIDPTTLKYDKWPHF